jgi:GNAT superfamily N-acetyltransferase
MEWNKDGYTISDQTERIDKQVVYRLLSATYWANNRPKQLVEKSIDHSLCFGIYCEGQQVGFSRVVTDQAVFAWIMDVVIDPDYRGRGLGKWMMACIMDLLSTNKHLGTQDAHGLYEQFGFQRYQPELMKCIGSQ